MGVLQSAADLARVYLHSAGAGIPEWAQRHFGDANIANQTDQMVAQSRARAGIAGDAVNAAGYFAPVMGAVKGVKAIRSLPEAAGAVRNLVHPGIMRSEALARLGLEAQPGVVARAAGAIAAHPWRTAAAAGALGVGTFAGYDTRTAQASPATVKPAAAATQSDVPQRPVPNFAVSSRNNSAGPAPGMLEGLLRAAGAEHGGKISLNQLNAIGDFVSHASPEIRHPPTYKDVAAQQLMAVDQDVWNQNQQQVQGLKADGKIDEAIALQQRGLEERQRRMAIILGQDPISLLTAQQAGAPQP